MVFQKIDGEFHLFTKNLKEVSLLSDEINNDLLHAIDKISDFTQEGQISTQNFANLMQDVDNISAKIGNNNALSEMFEQAAKSGKHAQLSIEDCYSAILNGNTKGFKNVSNVIKTFNSLDPNQQKAWATATGQSNKQLGKYLTNVKNGKASLIGYGVSLAGVTAKTVLATAATTLFNAAISFGISLLVQGLITAISDVIHREENLIKKQEELRESAKNLTSQYKSAKEEADKLNKSSGDLINRYAKLSQGVDALGNNVSLTNEEYEEYKELSNQIADDIPNLVKAYDTEGNAILSLRDNIDELKTAYQEAAKEKYSALLNSDDIKNALEAYSEFVKKFQQIDISGMGVGANTITVSKVGLNGMSNLDAMEVFEQLLKDHSIANISISNEELQKIFDDFNIEYDWNANHSNEQESKMYQDVSTALAKLRFEYSIYQASLDSLSNAILNIYDGFYKLPSELQTIANAVANNLPDSLTESLTGNVEEDKAKIAGYIYNVVDSLNNPETAEQVTEAYKKIFEITDKDLPIAETQKQVEHFVQQIMKSTGMEEGVVKTIFGLDNLDNLSNQLDAVKQRFVKSFDFSTEGIRENFFDGLLNELSGSEIPNTESEIKALAAAIDEVSQAGGKSTDVLEVYRKKISEFNGIDPEKYDITETTKNLQEAYNALIEFRRALSDYETTTADIEKSIRSMAETYKDNAEVKSAAEKYFTTHTKEAAQDFLETYKNVYLTDQNNFNTWLEEKRNVAKANENDADAWDKFSASDFVEVFKDAYGIDLTNYTSYLDMKNKLTQQWLNDNGIDISKIPATSAVNAILKAAEDALNLDEIAAMYGSFFDSYTPYVPNKTDKKSSGSSNDATKEAFEKDMKDIEHLHNMGLKSDEEYYEVLEKANEKHYKNSVDHESDYLSNIEKIYNARQSLYKDDADKQFDDLEDQYKRGIITAEQYAQGLHDLGQELYGEDSIYGGTEFAIKALEELDKKVKETSEDIYDEFKEGLSADGDKTLFNVLSDAEELWNKTNELFDGDLTLIKSNAKDIFGTVSSALEDALKKGIITVDGYESLLRSWANTLQVTEADVTDALVDTYEYRANALQKANDGSLASKRKYIADMKSLNFSTYGDENSDFYNPTTYASNLRDITDHQLEVLEKALNNGELSVQEYANSVVEIFKDADILGADYVSEKLDDIDKVRAEREKTYWEQQKELMEDYYDKQIKEIEETQKAKEKENKLEELHLKLIKARQTLEEAKNNRNQLVFHDGTFEYMADQDAVMSAEEEVANTLKEIEDEKLQAQIDLLEEQKDAALGFYDQILDEIDFYLNKTLPLSESDQEELAKIRNSDYAQYARDKRDGNLAANSDNEKIAENALNQTDTAEETKQSVSDIAKNVLDIAKVVANGFSFENLVRALGGNPTAEAVKNFRDSYNATLVGKQITPSTLPSNITNNSNTTNNTAKTEIHIDKIFENLNMPQGTTKEQVEEFFKHLNQAILQRIPQALIEVSK